MTLSVRRSVAAIAVGAALVLAGCSGPAGPDRAAVVDGQVLSERELQTTVGQVNGLQPALEQIQGPLSATSTLNVLVQGPVYLAYLRDRGVVVSDTVARQQAEQRGVADPADGTLTVIKLNSALAAAQDSGEFGEADAVAIQQQILDLDVEVNPRYGTRDTTTGAIQLTTPDWVTSPDAAQ
ncbi:MAG TPA: hypothetical protein VES93_04000 [Ornithinibacter sp.]|nr:hypothetical protein [Ornithinibacter sp.]